MSASKRGSGIDLGEFAVGVVSAVLFVVCVGVVIVNQQTVGWANLFAMLGALGVLILMLALYNRRYR